MKIENVVVGVAGVALLAYMAHRDAEMSSLAKNVGMSVKDLRNSDAIDIRESAVQTAIDQAVNSRVGRLFEQVRDSIARSARNDISESVRAEVNRQRDRIEAEVGRKVTDTISEAGQEKIVNAVCNKARDILAKKLEDKIDSVADSLVEGEDQKRRRVVIL